MRSDPLAGGERPIAGAAPVKRIGERELIAMMALLMACNAFGIDAILPALDDLALSLGAVGNDRQFIVGVYLLAAGIGTLRAMASAAARPACCHLASPSFIATAPARPVALPTMSRFHAISRTSTWYVSGVCPHA